MKADAKILLYFLKRLGIRRGFPTFLKFFTGHVERIKLPYIQYPFSIRANTSDIPSFFHVFFEKQYLFKLPEKPEIIVDCGSNIGLFAIQMKNMYPDSKIICIEPDCSNFCMLQKNLKPYNNIFLENKGLWNENTKLRTYDKYKTGKWGIVVEEDNDKGKIKGITMDSIMKKYAINHIDLLKIDIETSEKTVFASNYETWLPKVKTIIIELHDHKEPGCARAFFEAINNCFINYTYAVKGENTIIRNKTFDYSAKTEN